MRIRLFKSALNDVRYVLGAPLSFSAFRALPKAEQDRLTALARN